jgi:hypothetical protein
VGDCLNLGTAFPHHALLLRDVTLDRDHSFEAADDLQDALLRTLECDARIDFCGTGDAADSADDFSALRHEMLVVFRVNFHLAFGDRFELGGLDCLLLANDGDDFLVLVVIGGEDLLDGSTDLLDGSPFLADVVLRGDLNLLGDDVGELVLDLLNAVACFNDVFLLSSDDLMDEIELN